MKRGKLIVFEGLDHSGKTTQCFKLKDYLQSKGDQVEIIHFPNRKTQIGQIIDNYLKSSENLQDEVIHYLFCANRWEKNNEIKQKLQNGINIILDRYAYSGVAFTAAKKIKCLEWCKNGDKGLVKPDIVFFFDISVQEISKRNSFGEERYEKLDFQQNVYENFLLLSKEEKWIFVNATETIENLSLKINEYVDSYQQEKEIKELWMQCQLTVLNKISYSLSFK